MNIENQKFEEWRNEQINSLVRMGYPDAAKSFRDLGSIHWAGWQAAWKASRESLQIELPKPYTEHRLASKPERYGRNSAIDACAEAIHAAGVKTK
jgi:hypothetical protein